MATWEDVRKVAAALEDAEETTTHRMPCFKTGGKLFVNLSSHEPGALAVRAPRELQAAMVKARPELFFVTPHYEGYDAVLIRLETAKRKDLEEAIRNAHAYIRSTLKPRRAKAPVSRGRSPRASAGRKTKRTP